MTTSTVIDDTTPPHVDSGPTMLAALLAMHRIAADPAQLRHTVGHQRPLDATDILRLADAQGPVRARRRTARWPDLARLPLPALANGPDGWFMIGRVGEDEALVQWPGAQVSKLDRAQLGAVWSGEIVMLTTRETIDAATRRFDFTWFVPQVVKYRRLIGEVLLITLALNLLGLAAPLFFQNVVDKVLVNNTMSTLKVLAFGFLVVSV
jgi:subfamily B ATP-binding cassette protein HlyB/CyaB